MKFFVVVDFLILKEFKCVKLQQDCSTSPKGIVHTKVKKLFIMQNTHKISQSFVHTMKARWVQCDFGHKWQILWTKTFFCVSHYAVGIKGSYLAWRQRLIIDTVTQANLTRMSWAHDAMKRLLGHLKHIYVFYLCIFSPVCPSAWVSCLAGVSGWSLFPARLWDSPAPVPNTACGRPSAHRETGAQFVFHAIWDYKEVHGASLRVTGLASN